MNIEYFTEKIKNNLTLIILLPTVFGGLWQIIELSKMSISYIRFFSATQLLPDGLLMLFILTILYFAYRLGNLKKYKMNFKKKIMIINQNKPSNFIHYFIKTNKSNKLTFSQNNPIYEKSQIPVNVAIILIGIPFLWYMLSFFLFDKSYNLLSIMMSIVLSLLFGKLILSSAFILLIDMMESHTIKTINEYISDKPVLKEIALFPMKLIIAIIFVVSISLPIFLFSIFHQNYFLPANLKNLKNIQTSLKTTDYNKSEILYFNDKYIFIEHSNSDKNKTIEILLFDELFNKK